MRWASMDKSSRRCPQTETAKHAASKIALRSAEELATKLAANKMSKTNVTAMRVEFGKVETFTQLCAKTEGKELISRVASPGKINGNKTLHEYATVLASIVEDPNYKVIVDKFRMIN